MVRTYTYNNSPGLPWIVQKFGGTSIGKFLDNIANEVIKYVFNINKKQKTKCIKHIKLN